MELCDLSQNRERILVGVVKAIEYSAVVLLFGFFDATAAGQGRMCNLSRSYLFGQNWIQLQHKWDPAVLLYASRHQDWSIHVLLALLAVVTVSVSPASIGVTTFVVSVKVSENYETDLRLEGTWLF